MSNENPFLKIKKEKKRNVPAIVITVVAVLITSLALLYFFVFTPNEVSGPSMLPNFNDGEFLLVSRPHSWFFGTDLSNTLGLEFERGDVVIFSQPGEGDIVKRIIGVPGDTVRMERGVFYVNGNLVSENFGIFNNERKDGDFLKNGGASVTLKPDEFFLAGDNRDVSFDSRSLGPIGIEAIKGKVIYKIFPFERVKKGDLGF